MGKNLFVLLVMLPVTVGLVSAQTLLHEGKGAILSTTPATLVVPTQNVGFSTLGYNANASISYRLSNRFDVTGMLGYGNSTANARVAVGYTHRFSSSDWGFRSEAGVATFKPLEGGGKLVGAGNVSAMLFREINLFSAIELFPSAGVRSDVSRFLGTNVQLSADLGVPIYFKAFRNVRLFASPSYRIDLVNRFRTPRNVSIGFGAQLNL
jgi:hypothetical protein